MKKILCILLVSIIILAVACSSQSTTDTSANEGSSTSTGNSVNGTWDINNIREQTFMLAHGMGEASLAYAVYNEFVRAVDELSGGKMQVDHRFGGTIVTDADALDAVMSGTVDFVHSNSTYLASTIFDLAPLAIAGYYGGDNWKGFVNDTRELLTSIFADYGIVYIGAHPVVNYTGILSNPRPVHSPSDVRGMNFRASGTWISKTVAAWGASPVQIPLGDVPDSLSKNAIDGLVTGLQVVGDFKLYQVVRYVTLCTLYDSYAALLMNADRWRTLNADEQALLLEAGQVFEDNGQAIVHETTQRYLDEINDAGLNEIYTLTEAEQQAFIELAYGLYPEMEQTVGEKGKQLMEMLIRINGID